MNYIINQEIKQLEKKDNNKQQIIEDKRITLKIHFQLQVIDVLAEKDSTLQEIMIEVINLFSLYKPINNYGCFSLQKKQILRLDDTFDYTKSDTLFIFEKRLELMVQLDIEGVQENITFSLLESDTIKDIKTQLNDYLKQKKRPELKYIEIYKDSILQNDETITIFQLFKQPYIEVKSTSKNHENKNPNQISEKQQIEMQQNDFNIQSEIQLLKELFDTKLKNLQLLFMKMLNDSRNIIFKELEFLERDITQIQQLFKQPFNQQQLSQLIKSKQTLYNQQKQISQEHIQKLQSEFENFKQNLQKEQQKLQEKQRNCFEMVKIEMQTSIQSFQVDEQKVLRQTKILTDEEVTFEELIKYLEQTFPVEIKKYTQTLGPLRQWVGLSENKEKEVKLKEIVYNHQNELIKFGPIHIDIKSKQQQSSAIDINITLYELKNE